MTKRPSLPYIRRMKNGASDYNERFLARTAAARDQSGLTQKDVATALGIPQDHYKQFERRTLLPHRFVMPFCVTTRVNPEYLFRDEPQPNRPQQKSGKRRKPNGQAATRPPDDDSA